MNIQISECILDLGTRAEHINDPFSMGITETLKFSADSKGREFTKGRFNVSLAIVDQYKEPENGTYFDK